MEYLFYLLKMPLIKRKARVIPFGYKLADDTHYIEPVQEELDALREAKEYLNNCSYREVARWLSQKTNRSITHTGLRKIVDNRRWILNHQDQNKISEENEE